MSSPPLQQTARGNYPTNSKPPKTPRLRMCMYFYHLMQSCFLFFLETQQLLCPSTRQILSVTPGGVADRAGLRFGDVITEFDGKAVTTTTEVRSAACGLGFGGTRQYQWSLDDRWCVWRCCYCYCLMYQYLTACRGQTTAQN